MPLIRGCDIPERLYYDVTNQVWYEPLNDDTIRAGMTPAALALSGELLAFTPKRPGRDFEVGRYFATVESGKWVGPVRAGFNGTVVGYNEALMHRPGMANRDPYGTGWMLVVRAARADWRDALVTGADVAAAFEAWMEAQRFAGCGG